MDLIDVARERARDLLSPLDQRWAHVQGVARRAADLTLDLHEHERAVVLAAAWLHDIGYAPPIARSRFHPLDGARYLQDEGFPEVVAGLVAYHSGAVEEAEECGLGGELAVFRAPPDYLLDRLTASDMTTSPTGHPVPARERIAEILSRYPTTDPVHRAVTRSGASLIRTANIENERTLERERSSPQDS